MHLNKIKIRINQPDGYEHQMTQTIVYAKHFIDFLLNVPCYKKGLTNEHNKPFK